VDGESQTLWPDHCVIDTPGADFASGLDRQTFHAVFHKGTGRNADTYSGFFDDRRHKPTGLAGFLRERGVKDVFVMGLATEYCVKYTVLDALAEGFHVHVIADGCRAVELRAGDAAAALEEMRRAGATVLDSDEI
jgi:nicotinamidase/pyrazinamidase